MKGEKRKAKKKVSEKTAKEGKTELGKVTETRKKKIEKQHIFI